MINRRNFVMVLLAGVMMLATAGAAFAQDHSKELDELKERFISRFVVLTQLKRESKVGETHRGLAEVVKPEFNSQKADPGDEKSPTVAQFVQAENTDRNRLYQLLAEKAGTTPQKVAERDAMRRFDKAEPNELLKPANSGWVTKREYDQQQQK